jgi:hypothetical protein
MTQNGGILFRIDVCVAYVIMSIVEALPSLPNRSSFGLFYLPHGFESFDCYWLRDDLPLSRYVIRQGSVLLLRNRTNSAVATPTQTPSLTSSSLRSKQMRFSISDVYLILSITHSPHTSPTPYYPCLSAPTLSSALLCGETVLRMVSEVLHISSHSGEQSGDLLLTNANIIFARYPPPRSDIQRENEEKRYIDYLSLPHLGIHKIEKMTGKSGVCVCCKSFQTHSFVFREDIHLPKLLECMDSLAFPVRMTDSFAHVMKKHISYRDDGWDVFQGMWMGEGEGG